MKTKCKQYICKELYKEITPLCKSWASTTNAVSTAEDRAINIEKHSMHLSALLTGNNKYLNRRPRAAVEVQRAVKAAGNNGRASLDIYKRQYVPICGQSSHLRNQQGMVHL